MKVKVEGCITSIEEKVKDEKQFTDILIAQTGERIQVLVRLTGHCAENYDAFEVKEFLGKLMQWRTKEGPIGCMVMVN